jgi:hypothetical protein
MLLNFKILDFYSKVEYDLYMNQYFAEKFPGKLAVLKIFVFFKLTHL